MRALGLDLGSVRIGVALSNTEGTLAVPYQVIHRSKDRNGDHEQIARLVSETEAERVVVGLPYSLDGSLGPAARRALAEVKLLRKVISVDIETYDERFTTVTADRSLREMNLSASARRKMVDSVAASVILQAWLDHRRLESRSDEGRDENKEQHA
ncbi:MAG: Holliday junction resolvase RuvX [Actinomycetes bacterium]